MVDSPLRPRSFFFSQRDAVDKRLHRSFAVTPPALMGSFFIVPPEPCLQITLEFFECFVDLLAKRYPVELIEHRLVKALTTPISLGTLGLGPGVVDIFHRQGHSYHGRRSHSTASPDRSALSIMRSHALQRMAALGH